MSVNQCIPSYRCRNADHHFAYHPCFLLTFASEKIRQGVSIIQVLPRRLPTALRISAWKHAPRACQPKSPRPFPTSVTFHRHWLRSCNSRQKVAPARGSTPKQIKWTRRLWVYYLQNVSINHFPNDFMGTVCMMHISYISILCISCILCR